MEARKRTAIDGRVWWCVWDNEKGDEWDDKIGAFQEAASSVQDAMDYLEEYV